MKKVMFTLLVAIMLLAAIAGPAYAGGGQVRGANGQGSVVQVQTQNPPPFQP